MTKGSLHQLLQIKHEELPWKLRYQIAMDICFGLNDLHVNKIIHRDLKSLNVLLNDRLRAKLTDFGLSKIRLGSIQSTQSNQLHGTVQWMAPEAIKSPQDESFASDVWSLGVVLWELLTRKTPFSDSQRNIAQLLVAIMFGETEKFPKEDDHLELQSIIKACWNSKPEVSVQNLMKWQHN